MLIDKSELERELRAWASGYTLAFLLSLGAVGWSCVTWWAGARDVPSGLGLGLSGLATLALGWLTWLQARMRRSRRCAKCHRDYSFLTDPMAIVVLCGRCVAHLRS
jgi:hypothetical protein